MDDEARRGDDPFDDLAELFDEQPSPPPGVTPGDVDAAPADEESRTTEWFSVEDYLAMEDEPPALPRRQHHVTTVVVSHDGDVWLPAVLTTLAGQTRRTSKTRHTPPPRGMVV